MMRSHQCSARHIEGFLHRSSTSITRLLKRFATWQDRPAFSRESAFGHDVRVACQRACCQRSKSRRCSKLAMYTVLFGVGPHFCPNAGRPSQMAGALRPYFSGLSLTYRLVREHLQLHLCHASGVIAQWADCLPAPSPEHMHAASQGSKQQGRVLKVLGIHVLPPEANGRSFPRYW